MNNEESIKFKYIKNKNSNLRGILLIMPIYMIYFILANKLGLNGDNNEILIPILMYLPIIIGICLSYKDYKNRFSMPLMIFVLIFVILSIHFYYDTYFVEHSGWDGLGSYLFWLLNTIICKIFSCIFYIRLVGIKKGLLFLGFYVICIALSLAIGFWA